MRYGTRASQVHTNCAATQLSNWRYVTTTATQRNMRAGEKSRGRHYTTTQQSVAAAAAAATAFVRSARTVKWAGGVRTSDDLDGSTRWQPGPLPAAAAIDSAAIMPASNDRGPSSPPLETMTFRAKRVGRTIILLWSRRRIRRQSRVVFIIIIICNML